MTPDRDPQLLKGVLPMLVLALLTEQESYGYELVTRLQARGLAEMTTGTVYPVLTRLERDGHITSRLVPSTAGPARKYYVPSTAGARELARAADAWDQLTVVVAATLGPPSPTTTPAPSATRRPAHPPIPEEHP